MTSLFMNSQLKFAVRTTPSRVFYAVSPMLIVAEPEIYGDKKFVVLRYPKKMAGWSEKPFAEVTQLMLEPAKSSRSEEHTSELQSLMRISYAVFCLKKNKTSIHQ